MIPLGTGCGISNRSMLCVRGSPGNICLNVSSSSCILLFFPSKLQLPIQATHDNKHKNQLTMPVIMQIHQLISPLRKNPQRILQESDHNEEAADGRQVGLDRLAERVQPVLDLARLLADGVEGRRVVGRVAARRAGVEACVLALEVVAGGATDGHGGRLWCK